MPVGAAPDLVPLPQPAPDLWIRCDLMWEAGIEGKETVLSAFWSVEQASWGRLVDLSEPHYFLRSVCPPSLAHPI